MQLLSNTTKNLIEWAADNFNVKKREKMQSYAGLGTYGWLHFIEAMNGVRTLSSHIKKTLPARITHIATDATAFSKPAGNAWVFCNVDNNKNHNKVEQRTFSYFLKNGTIFFTKTQKRHNTECDTCHM